MPIICVEIEMNSDTGEVKVGVCPPEEEAGEPKSYMQPAQSVDEALAKAQQLLSQGGAGQPGQSPDQQMAAGYEAVRGGGLNGAMPQGQA
jgi:hypothetical protein